MAEIRDPSLKKSLSEQGFAHCSKAVPNDLVLRARRHINASLGDARCGGEVFYLPDLDSDPEILDLFWQTGVLAPFHGAGREGLSLETQIVLRLPTANHKRRLDAPHVDGTPNPHQSLSRGQLRAFDFTVMIYLSDVPEPFCGNFTVWPRSHLALKALLVREGDEELRQSEDAGRALLSRLDLESPVQICGGAGDLILCSGHLAHSGAPNFSPDIRYGVVFRARVGTCG